MQGPRPCPWQPYHEPAASRAAVSRAAAPRDTFSRSISLHFHKICANGKQPVAFQHSQVALITERHPAVHQIFPVNPEPFQKPFPYRPGHQQDSPQNSMAFTQVFSPGYLPLWSSRWCSLVSRFMGLSSSQEYSWFYKTPGIFPVPGQAYAWPGDRSSTGGG